MQMPEGHGPSRNHSCLCWNQSCFYYLPGKPGSDCSGASPRCLARCGELTLAQGLHRCNPWRPGRDWARMRPGVSPCRTGHSSLLEAGRFLEQNAGASGVTVPFRDASSRSVYEYIKLFRIAWWALPIHRTSKVAKSIGNHEVTLPVFNSEVFA